MNLHPFPAAATLYAAPNCKDNPPNNLNPSGPSLPLHYRPLVAIQMPWTSGQPQGGAHGVVGRARYVVAQASATCISSRLISTADSTPPFRNSRPAGVPNR